MQNLTPAYNIINEYTRNYDLKLLIIDFNGVLDDYHARKVTFLDKVLGSEQRHHLPELLLAIEKDYIKDRNTSIEQSFIQFFARLELHVTDEQRNALTHQPFFSSITNDAKAFLDSLEIAFIIYTALTRDQAIKALGITQYDIFTRDQYQEEKPSLANLRIIMEKYNVLPHQICVIGDSLIDDLMPASLLGAHTILVSPFAKELVNIPGA